MLATRLALVGDLVGKTEECAFPKGSVYDNLHFMRYIIEKVSKVPGTVRLGCLLLSYALTLESLLHKLEALGGTLRDIACGISVSATCQQCYHSSVGSLTHRNARHRSQGLLSGSKSDN